MTPIAVNLIPGYFLCFRRKQRQLPSNHERIRCQGNARGGRAMGRMSRHMSLAPDVMMATQEEVPERTPLKEFICSHVKTIVTVFMIFGTIAVIVLIVMGK